MGQTRDPLRVFWVFLAFFGWGEIDNKQNNKVNIYSYLGEGAGTQGEKACSEKRQAG